MQWAYPKLQIDGRNHKNMGVRRAILHKANLDGRLGHTGIAFAPEEAIV